MRNLRNLVISMILLVAAISGCSKPASPDTADTKGPVQAKGEETASPSAAKPAPDPSTIPSEVKHTGYPYYGLDHAKPIEYEVRRSDRSDTSMGTATTRLTVVKDGVAGFITERTGALSELGAEEVEARKDGIYNVRIGGKEVKPQQLVMPADLAVGKTWSTKSAVELDTGRVEESLNFKVAGQEKVKTKAGEFDAMKVTASGEFKVGDQSAKANVTAWYVKEVGTVKMTIVRNDPGGKPLTMTVEATKVG
jgi:hypothetical protein